MRTTRRLAAVVALCAPLLAAPRVGLADPKAPPPAAVAKIRRDANNVTGISEFMEICVQANARYVSKDMSGAIELYRKAIKLAPRNPLGHYWLGEALLGTGSLDEAVAEWLVADQVVDNGPPEVKAKVLFILADMRERQKKWNEAKTAWQRYLEYVQKHGDANGSPGSGTARIQSIDEMQRQDTAYEIVRQRIKAERENPPTPPK